MPKKISSSLKPVAVLGGVRLPFCRSNTNYAEISGLELLSESMRQLVSQYSLRGEVMGDVALGTTFYHPSTWNMAREAVLASGLAPESPAMGTQRACATSLDAAVNIANKIALGKIECGIAGGCESISNVSLYYNQNLSRRIIKTSQGKTMMDRLGAWRGINFSELKPVAPPAVEASTGKSMGQHCEMMAKQWKVTREEQDELAYASHKNGVAAYERGFYDDLVVPYNDVKRDNNLRADTSLEKLAKLKPAFDRTGGTLTAGNSSPLTDGAAAVLLGTEEWAKAHGIPVLAYLTEYENAAIDISKEGLLMAPAYAAPRMFDRMGVTLQDFDFYEIHEAFAAQVLCTLKAWESAEFCREHLKKEAPLGSIDRKKLNVVGGSTALGHPFGATGARLIATMAKLLSEKGSGKGFLSICTGGGMGTVAVMER